MEYSMGLNWKNSFKDIFSYLARALLLEKDKLDLYLLCYTTDSMVIENPIQASALYYILVTLNDFGLLENEPLTVSIKRDERDPVYPCGRGDQELKMNQVKCGHEKARACATPRARMVHLLHQNKNSPSLFTRSTCTLPFLSTI